MDEGPGVPGVFRGAHLDRGLQLVGELAGSPEGLPRVRLGRLPLPEQFGESLELVAELVEPPGSLDLLLLASALTQDFLGFLGPGPEVRGGGLLPQAFERAPRGV